MFLQIRTYNKQAKENEIDVYTHRKIIFMMQMLKHFMEMEVFNLLLSKRIQGMITLFCRMAEYALCIDIDFTNFVSYTLVDVVMREEMVYLTKSYA